MNRTFPASLVVEKSAIFEKHQIFFSDNRQFRCYSPLNPSSQKHCRKMIVQTQILRATNGNLMMSVMLSRIGTCVPCRIAPTDQIPRLATRAPSSGGPPRVPASPRLNGYCDKVSANSNMNPRLTTQLCCTEQNKKLSSGGHLAITNPRRDEHAITNTSFKPFLIEIHNSETFSHSSSSHGHILFILLRDGKSMVYVTAAALCFIFRAPTAMVTATPSTVQDEKTIMTWPMTRAGVAQQWYEV